MPFIKAMAGVPSKGKVKVFCTVRLRENGNAQLTMSRGFVDRFFAGATSADRFAVQWGTEGHAGQAMIARIASGDLVATDLRGALALMCRKPPHAPRGDRPSSPCRIMRVVDGAVLIELPEWVPT